MAGLGATAAGGVFSSSPELEEGEAEAAGSTSADGGGAAANTTRALVRRTIGRPDPAAVLARVSLSCKTEPMEGDEGRGTYG